MMRRNPLFAVFLTVLVDLIGVGILIPVIPALLADPHSASRLFASGVHIQTGYIILGMLTASYSLMQFLAAPILGQLSDRYGRKPVLLISLAGTCISYLFFAYGIFAKSLVLLFISRAFDGVTGGNISVAQATIADVTTPENRSKNFGLIGAAFGIGFIIGPFLGGVLSDASIVSWFNATIPFLFAAALALLNVVSVFLFLPETHVHREEVRPVAWGASVRHIVSAFNMKGMRSLFATSFLFTGGFTFFTTFFSVFLISRFGFSEAHIGSYFAYVGLWIAFTQIFVVRRLSGAFSEPALLRVSLFLCAALIALFFLPTRSWELYFVTPFFAIFTGIIQANLPGLVSRSVGPESQGEILGIHASLQALAQSIPPIISGFIAAILTPTAPIYVASLVIASGGCVFLVTWKHRETVRVERA